MGQRQLQLKSWVELVLSGIEGDQAELISLDAVSGDASFRRYFRAYTQKGHYIAVDAPPEKENSEPFIRIARCWFEQGVRVPEVIRSDLEQGFMLLEDFGDRQLLAELGGQREPYAQALDTLLKIQQLPAKDLPPYDEPVLRREMDLFSDWFLDRLLQTEKHPVKQQLESVFKELVTSAQSQPQVCVHRDYHSRNLMPLADRGLGVIDFQDALIGPITYDLVSLLRDSYVDWPDSLVYSWVEEYRASLANVGFEMPEAEAFRKSFDLMGMQRQLKVVGIFSRLLLRDGKSGYLKDIPRTFAYLLNAAKRYPEFDSFAKQLESLLPLMKSHPELGVYMESVAESVEVGA